MTETTLISTDGIDKWVSDAINYAKSNYHMHPTALHFFATAPEQPINLSIFGILHADIISLINAIAITANTPLDESKYGKYAGLNKDTDTFFSKINEMVKLTGEKNMSSYHILMALVDSDEFSKHFNDNGVTLEGIQRAIQSLGDEPVSYHPGSGVYNKNKQHKPIKSSERAHNKNVADLSLGDDETRTTTHLDKFGVNLTSLASNGKLGAIIGRDDEIRNIIRLLSRSTKNNPVVIGEAGVGKTAVIEGLAHRIVKGDVPKTLQNAQLYSLDLTSLVAGAKMRGEFEERFRGVLEEVRASNGEIILFIDEIHGINAGNGASDVLKPVLARGNLRIIGATTSDEYRQHIDIDPALARRFQKVTVTEPSIQDSVAILRGIVKRFEDYHKVQIDDNALVSAVTLSNRYITSMKLPDKAIDIIDEAAAKMRMELDSAPAELDSLSRKLKRTTMEEISLSKFSDPASAIALVEVSQKKANLEERVIELKARWKAEQDTRTEIDSIRAEITKLKLEETARIDDGDLEGASEIKYESLANKRAQLETALEQASAISPLISDSVGVNEVAEIVQLWSGVPVGNMLESESEKLIRMESEIAKRLIGQEGAVKAVSNAIRRSRAGVSDPKRPTGSFMFLGTSGSGKTLLCKALADFLFDDESAVVRIDMSEFSEKHSVARLIGAPPGYVGYEAGGQLTESVREKPYSVVLFDEVEKAHTEIFDILLQVLDDGHLTDGQGRTVNFKNTIIVLTSNLGANYLIQDDLTDSQKHSAVMSAVKDKFRPEFINRLDELVIFSPFTKEELQKIVTIELAQFTKRLQSRRIEFNIKETALQWLSTEGYDPNYGARPLRRLIQTEIGDKMAMMLLDNTVDDDDIITITHEPNTQELTLSVEKREWQNDIISTTSNQKEQNHEAN